MPGKICEACGRTVPPSMIRCPACGALQPGAGAEEAAAVAEDVAQALGSHYRIEELIGRGGYAYVFRVHDERLDRKLAVKALIPEFAAFPAIALRFRREARTAARLNHPGIVPIYFVGDEGHTPCFVMPLVEGEPLSARIRREGQLPFSVAVGVARDVATALDFAHSHGVIHRDVKPDNVLLEFSTGRSLLADFGIAKALEGHPDVTASGIAMGTPHYMAPEQAESSRDVDARADTYSLGVVVYEMLAGTPPFGGKTAQEIVSRHLAAPVPSLRLQRPEVSEDVDRVLQRALAKEPGDRYAAAGELVRALEGAFGQSSLRHSGGTTIPLQRLDDRHFASRSSGLADPIEALAHAPDLPTLTDAAQALETYTLEAAGRAEGGLVVNALRALGLRAADAQVGFRQPARELLERLASHQVVAEALASTWRAADTQEQVRVEGIIVELLPGIAEPLLAIARREKAPELFLLADRVGALSDSSADLLARDPSAVVARAFVLALGESQRPGPSIERWLSLAARHPSAGVRAAVQEIAASRGGGLAERIGRLGTVDPDQSVRLAAIRALGASARREVLPELGRLLDAGARDDQVAAATALGSLALPAALPMLARVFERKTLFRKERGPVQVAAAQAVARLPRETSNALLTMLSADGDREVARIASEALKTRGS